jgi:outer membrane protein TolC
MSSRSLWPIAAVLLFSLGLLCPEAPGQQPAEKKTEDLPQPRPLPGTTSTPPAASLLNPQVTPLDLCTALKLAGVYNPEMLLARQRVTAADAQRQLAAAQFLPTINYGSNYDAHQGVLQQSTGRVIQTNRDAAYFGLGSGAVAAGTVAIPGVVLSGNVSETIYNFLTARQVVRQREFESDAVRNEVLLRVVVAYLELLRATGRRAVAAQTRADAAEVARITANFAKTGQGKRSDAERSSAELQLQDDQLLQADASIQVASARLAQLLNLDPSVRLHPSDGWVVPAPMVPDPIPLRELLAIAVTQRPELRARQAAIRAALLQLQAAKVLPFSPNILIGYSNGSFGGGSNLNTLSSGASRFGNFDDRQDIDVVMYWSLRNLGVGNLAQIKLARSNLRQDELRQIVVFDQIRMEVAAGHARAHARYAQIGTGERAVVAGTKAFRQDLFRILNREGLAIELLDSLRLLERGRVAFLDAIVDYNRAQFELYVALGQPPACVLARSVPTTLVPAIVPPAPPPAATPPVAPPPQGPARK